MIKQKVNYKLILKNADTLTPVGIFKRLEGPKKFLLESSFQHETKGKYSYIGANPFQEIIGSGNETKVIDLETKEEKIVNQTAIEYLTNNFPKIDCELPLPFTGGAIGYVAYDAIRQFANIGEQLTDELNMPDYHFMVYHTIIIYEHRTEKAHILTLNIDESAEEKLEERIERINEQLDKQITIPDPKLHSITFEPKIPKETFIENVKKAKTFIENKEADQIVISQRMIAELDGDPFSFYRELRTSNPSPYMFYIDFTDYLIIGASPESLVQTTGDQVVTNPIAGTRRRGKSLAEDEALKKELLTDPKELSEHDMLVELSKTDLLAACEKESIHVPVYKDVVKYEHVMHIVSEVHGTLQEDKTSMDALIACLPAGTVSGSPKERAMQIINDIETERRGFYAGGIGYISFNHDINLAISIRSIVVKHNRAYLQTGAGIVADSIPENEYFETLHKAKSLTNLNKEMKGV
ncbi:anthranilate synthase component I [Pseudogracilibacillus sp. SE30717A]|uniref:anthranilate synthase component I n=1 Tax=Pseudogracilibacillus sp. SE30717A TaxID=3098293 RepID=UPI00300E1164